MDKQQEEYVLFLEDETESVEPDLQRFRELLGIDPDVREFRLTYGLVPEKPGDIAVLTGSIWDIMLNLAWQFEVPDAHVTGGRTGESHRSARSDGVPPIAVHFSTEEPVDAFVAIRAHGHWFYIDQRDRKSKRTFSFLQMLLNLAETAVPDRSPLVTISP